MRHPPSPIGGQRSQHGEVFCEEDELTEFRLKSGLFLSGAAGTHTVRSMNKGATEKGLSARDRAERPAAAASAAAFSAGT